MIDVHSYDYYIVTFSGGKDSTACFLHLLDLGIPKEKIELWHHLVDGREGSNEILDTPLTLMDWECTEDYCRKFAAAFGVKIYFSWLRGGFYKEMMRDGQATEISIYEQEDEEGKITYGCSGGDGPAGTRLKFPQVSPDLSVRWCSSYLKIEVGRKAITGQLRFTNKRTLLISGERAEESAGRALYDPFKPDKVDKRDSDRQKRSRRRLVDRWMPIHSWKESDVWGIIQRHAVVPHPCYYLGYSRCSCKWCIFGNADQFASSFALSPSQGETLANLEERFRSTIKRDVSLTELIKKGVPYEGITKYPGKALQAISYEYNDPIFTTGWELPGGAYGKSLGPT